MKRLTGLALALIVALVLQGSVARPAGAVATPAHPVHSTRTLTAGAFLPEFAGDWPPEAKAAWDKVAASLSAHIAVTVPIEVKITWEPLDGGFLGKGGSSGSQVNFPGAPMADTWYPISLANQLAGHRLDAGPDIEVQINSEEDWDFSGNPQRALADGSNDFVTTLMHEIIHGMGFLGTADVTGSEGRWGDSDGELEPERRWAGHARAGNRFVCTAYPSPAPAPVATVRASTTAGFPEVWDQFVMNGAGQPMLDTGVFPNPSPALGAFLTSDDLFWRGDGGRSANGGAPVKLYAPPEWQPASSYSHLDDAVYDGGPDALLTSAGANLPGIDMGPRVLGMMADMGWAIR